MRAPQIIVARITAFAVLPLMACSSLAAEGIVAVARPSVGIERTSSKATESPAPDAAASAAARAIQSALHKIDLREAEHVRVTPVGTRVVVEGIVADVKQRAAVIQVALAAAPKATLDFMLDIPKRRDRG